MAATSQGLRQRFAAGDGLVTSASGIAALGKVTHSPMKHIKACLGDHRCLSTSGLQNASAADKPSGRLQSLWPYPTWSPAGLCTYTAFLVCCAAYFYVRVTTTLDLAEYLWCVALDPAHLTACLFAWANSDA